MPHKIDTPEHREKLSPRREPYWDRITQGKHLGFRKTNIGGHWIARLHPSGGKRQFKPLGSEQKLDFSTALAKALEWLEDICGPEPAETRVKHAISHYLDYLYDECSPSSYSTMKSRADRHILPQLGEQRIADLKTKDYEDWLSGTAKRIERGSDNESRRKARYGANECLKILKAALNQAHKSNRELPRDEWSHVERLKGGVTAGRKIFLTGNEPQRLVNACEGAFRDLVMFGLMTGCRLGEAYSMRVRDFDPDRGEWDVEFSKTGPRVCVLQDDSIVLLRRLCAGKKKDDVVFLRDDGVPWNRANVQPPMKRAVARAELDPATTYYALRHSYISSQLKAGVPPQIVAENVGTSVTMIEKHYGKFLPSEKRRWLAQGQLELDFPESNVVSIS
jgi:integrase